MPPSIPIEINIPLVREDFLGRVQSSICLSLGSGRVIFTSIHSYFSAMTVSTSLEEETDLLNVEFLFVQANYVFIDCERFSKVVSSSRRLETDNTVCFSRIDSIGSLFGGCSNMQRCKWSILPSIGQILLSFIGLLEVFLR